MSPADSHMPLRGKCNGLPTVIIFDNFIERVSSQLAYPSEIALMNLAAISSRGSRRDFINLYKIMMRGESLQHFLDLLPKKYGPERVNIYHILKSLTWFEDSEKEPVPTMLKPFDWEECKAFFVREAHAIVLGP